MSTQQKLLALAILAAVLLLTYLLRPILAPFLVGILIAYLGDPLVDRLESVGCARTVAVLIVFLLFAALFVGATLILAPVLVREIGTAVSAIPDLIQWLQESVRPFLVAQLGVDIARADTEAMKRSLVANWREAGGVLGHVLTEMTRSGVALVTWIANLGLIPVVAFYLMRDWDRLLARLRELLPPAIEGSVVELTAECDEVVSAFLRGQLLIMCLLAMIYAGGLWRVGLDLAIAIGLLSGLASIVPYLGFIVGIATASIAALFQFQDGIHLLYVGGVFAVGQALEGWILTPLLVGDRIGLHPVAVIFAILAGGQLFGFVGVLLALPAAAVIVVFLRRLHEQYRSSDLFVPGEEEG